jgi:hypothetical protein
MRAHITATLLAGLIGIATVGQAEAASVTFSELTGLAGGSPAATGVYIADLSSLPFGQIASVSITDNSSSAAGSPGQFSGFDLDAIVISTTLISDASQVGTLNRAGTFNFGSSIFTAGAQTPPTDPALIGTSGGQLDNSFATLDAFDGNSTTSIPGAFGFISLGIGGELSLNLNSALPTGGPIYLYIGEVGNNGEVAASNVDVSSQRVPEPFSIAIFSAGLGLTAATRRRKAKAA